MRILIFKTDINSPDRVKTVRPVLNRNPVIFRWTIDTEDVDNVLRVEASDTLIEADIIKLISPIGLKCEELPD